MTVVIGTAGHIDHGKTTLLRALTGIDADRLPEERRREMTIDVGYAHGSPDDGAEVDFVDVPGHDRLVGNMLVGIGEIDAALLVVAADDGPRAQTWEHLGLLDAMAIDMGVVAVTKCDLVDRARVHDVRADVARSIRPTVLGGSAVVAVSATRGSGLAELRGELAMLRDRIIESRRTRHQGIWLAIDRAFSIRGHGAVVTGSSRGAPVRHGDTVAIRPGRLRARVRAIHVHDVAVDGAAGDGRVALNLAGVELDALRRGQLVTSPRTGAGAREPFESSRLLVSLEPPAVLPGRRPDEAWPPRDGTESMLHIGTEHVEARLARSGRLAAMPVGGPALTMLRLRHPVATAVGERLLLRRPPPAGLLGGGVVLGAGLPRGRARSRATPERLDQLLAAVDAMDAAAIEAALVELHGSWGGRLAPDIERHAAATLADWVRAHERDHPERAGMALSAARSVVAGALREQLSAPRETIDASADRCIDAMVRAGRLRRRADAVHSPSFEPAAVDPRVTEAAERLIELLDEDAPPSLAAALDRSGCSPSMARALEREGRIVVVDGDLAWSAAAFGRLASMALALSDEAPLTPAHLRDASGTSRRYVMALLGELDRRGILRRTRDGHVRGPRA